MMKAAIQICRSLLFDICFYFISALFVIIGFPFTFGPSSWTRWTPYYHSKVFLWLCNKILGLKLRVEGAESIPNGPCIIASKHQSAWETCVFASLLNDPLVVIKQELTYIPCYGALLLHRGAIPVARGGKTSLKKMLSAARFSLTSGRPLLIFPEGTRAMPDQQPNYQRGVALFYKHLNLPVIPVALNSGYFWGRRSFIKKSGEVVIRFLPPIPSGLPEDQFMTSLQQTIEDACNQIKPANILALPAEPVLQDLT